MECKFFLLTVILPCLFIPGAPLVSAQEAERTATVFNYEIDAAMTYLDEAEMPDLTGAADYRGALRPRSLGLTRFRTVLSWQALSSTKFTAVLRPDAVQRSVEGQPAREFDARAGTTYRAKPTIQVLDAYQIELQPGPGYDLSFGVHENFGGGFITYPQLLEFGLHTRFPAKFFAFRVGLDRLDVPPPSATPVLPSGFDFDFYVIQGDEDRSETYSFDADSHDVAPVAQDPYYGGAMAVRWLAGPFLELGLTGGYLDQGTDIGKKSELFIETGSTVTLVALGKTLRTGLSFRYVAESWRRSGIADRVQQSSTLTTSTALSSNLRYLFGFHFGRSERPMVDDLDEVFSVSEFQVETGLISKLGPGLTMQIMVAQEKREKETSPGKTVGALGDDATVRRIGLEIAYWMEDGR